MRGSNVRLIVALIVASTLGAALIYSTVLGGTVDVVQVGQLLAEAGPSGDVRLNGTVVSHEGDAASASGLRIQLADNKAYSENPATARTHLDRLPRLRAVGLPRRARDPDRRQGARARRSTPATTR